MLYIKNKNAKFHVSLSIMDLSVSEPFFFLLISSGGREPVRLLFSKFLEREKIIV